jgi:uncharacterized glyoxalase superfamily protein PhnB
MTDPLDVLATPVEPVRPSDAFAAGLRSRLERALSAPEGVAVSEVNLIETTDPSAPASSVPVGVVPYLAVDGGRQAIEWYATALGAREVGERYESPDGQVGHAELTVHGATFYLSDSAPALGVEAISPDDAVHTSLVLSVPDVDAATDRTVEAGARLERPPTDYPYGRMSVIRDPFGHRWMLESPVTATAPSEPDPIRHGDIGFLSVHVPDVDRARRFYATVLGWEYGTDGRLVTNTSLPQGLWATEGTPTLLCSYAVESVDAAVDEVRAAGGTATEPADRPYGRTSDCVRGLRAATRQRAPGAERHAPGRSRLCHVRRRRLESGSGVLRRRTGLAIRAGSGRGRLERRRPGAHDRTRRRRRRGHHADVAGRRHRRRRRPGAQGRWHRHGAGAPALWHQQPVHR